MEHTGETFEQAVEAIRRAAEKRVIENKLRQQQLAMAARTAKKERRLDRQSVYPEPQSVRAIPVSFETSRKRH